MRQQMLAGKAFAVSPSPSPSPSWPVAVKSIVSANAPVACAHPASLQFRRIKGVQRCRRRRQIAIVAIKQSRWWQVAYARNHRCQPSAKSPNPSSAHEVAVTAVASLIAMLDSAASPHLA
jgi:hypothetical protein